MIQGSVQTRTNSVIQLIHNHVFSKYQDYASAPPHVKLWYNILKQAIRDLYLPVNVNAMGDDENAFDRCTAVHFLNSDLDLAQALVDDDWVRRILYEHKLLERK